MKTDLTPKQSKIYDFISDYYDKKHYAPSLKEIAVHFNRSVPTIYQYTKILGRKGFLTQGNLAIRNIIPVDSSENQNLGVSYQIGIIGFGIVGQAVKYGFSNCPIHIYDKYKKYDSLEEVVDKSDYIFVCLPTPIKDDESGIDLTIIDENIAEIAKLSKGTDKIIIIKSTVVPGTTQSYINKYPQCLFCFNPEFLREASFLQDFVNSDRIIIASNNDLVLRRVSSLYQSVMPSNSIFLTDPTTAEMVKYMSNCFLATKVIFANEMSQICDKMQINYEEVKKMVVVDKRIEDTHLDVTSLRGFGGKCLPKDLLALRALAKEKRVETELLDTVWTKNLKIRKARDWEEIPFAVSPSFGHRG